MDIENTGPDKIEILMAYAITAGTKKVKEGVCLVTIQKDGTVVVHKESGDKEAAKAFYEALEIEGKTLHNRIAELEKENEVLRAKVNELQALIKELIVDCDEIIEGLKA